MARMPVRRKTAWSEVVLGVACATLAVSSIGCGGVLYTFKSLGASGKLDEAEALGAEQYAPYEYFYAREHLNKAAEEAATADYGDAIDYVDVADEYADKAIRLARDAHGSAGR